MTEAEFDSFMEISMQDQAQGQVRAGRMPAERADDIIQEQRDFLLPEGLATPNHFFFSIEDEGSGTQVGGLWYTIDEEKRRLFVMDVQVKPEHRRRGYGTQAFRLMEKQARKRGITTIALHVFRHNHSARAMYEKLGYVGQDEMMSKELSADVTSD
jgi:GNAT superfamily N-acetyltransferase